VAGARDPIGGYTKTREQTNLPKPRTFGNDIFVITEFRFDVQVVPDNRNTANFQADNFLQATYGRYLSEYLAPFCDQGVFNFDIDSETVLTLSKPLATCPAGFGVALQQVPVATDVTPALGQSQIGARPSASQANVYQLDPPQLMEPERQFTAS